MATSKERGSAQEQRARDYLQQQGLKFVSSNYHCRFGEIDLIMLQAKTLCFIEVRYRHSTAFGGAMASITAAKQRKLILTAEHFLQNHPRYQKLAARFDCISLQGSLDNPEIDWIDNAFLVS